MLQDLRSLRIGGDAVLQRLAQLDPGRCQLRSLFILDRQSAFDQSLADLGVAGLKRNVLVDAVEHLEQGKVFERDWFHGFPPMLMGRGASTLACCNGQYVMSDCGSCGPKPAGFG
ncbi:MAG: hypothetical protein ABIW35_07925 [Luteimonas sp.]